MDPILLGFKLILEPFTMMVIVLASAFGLFMGAMPGLTAAMATALLVPITFFMAPVPSLAGIVAACAMAIFAGDIPSILLRIPGTPASAAYTDEAYAMTKKGQAELAMGICLVSSAIGGIAGSLALALASPALAELAIGFGSFEYFWLAVLGLSCAAFISADRPIKAVISLMIGLFLSVIGVDPTSGYPRFTFGTNVLAGGIEFIPVLVGMFAVSEVLRNVTDMEPQHHVAKVGIKLANIYKGLGAVLWKYRLGLARGCVVGTIIGALPGAGCDIAAWISYGTSKKLSKEPEKYGTGHPEGLVDAGASNNAALGGTWIPALVFGIPGDSITAIVIGVLYLKGINPGPTVFLQRPEIMYAVFIAFILSNILMLPFGMIAIKAAKYVLNVPRETLMPIILLFCMVGTFAMNNSVFGIVVMASMGILAYLMEENGFPIAPAVLGLVLGPLIEDNFVTSMMKANGNPLEFFTRPGAGVLGALVMAVWFSPLILKLVRRGHKVPISPAS